MDLWRIAVRVLAAYIYLMLITRAAGKRVLSQATPFDLLVSLIVGDLIDDVLWAEVSVAKFAGGAGTIFLCDMVAKITAFHSRPIFRIVNGTPRIVLRNGKVQHDELRREQLNDIDLAHLLRLDGIEKWDDVRIGFIERDHEVSALERGPKMPATKKDAERARGLLQ